MRALALVLILAGCTSPAQDTPDAVSGPASQDPSSCAPTRLVVSCATVVTGRMCVDDLANAKCIDGGLACPPHTIPRTECECFVDGKTPPGDHCPVADADTDVTDAAIDTAEVSDAACMPKPIVCTSSPNPVFPFDPIAKCRRCASEQACGTECGPSPACVVKIATGELHYVFFDCTAPLADAGFRACTADEQKTMGATWPPPPMCP